MSASFYREKDMQMKNKKTNGTHYEGDVSGEDQPSKEGELLPPTPGEKPKNLK
jgi:hypothetical protein